MVRNLGTTNESEIRVDSRDEERTIRKPTGSLKMAKDFGGEAGSITFSKTRRYLSFIICDSPRKSLWIEIVTVHGLFNIHLGYSMYISINILESEKLMDYFKLLVYGLKLLGKSIGLAIMLGLVTLVSKHERDGDCIIWESSPSTLFE